MEIKRRKTERFGSYGNILKVNLRHQFPGPALAALALAVLTGLVFNLNALESAAVAKPLELLLIWIGPAVLVPVFGPEQNPEIRDVVRTRRIDYLQVCVLRIGYSALTVALLSVLFTGMMKAGESQVLPYHLWGSICSALLLGAVGMAVAGISGNTAAGFMVCMLYYLASYGMKNKLGVFSLFSMTGGMMTGKGWQLLAAFFLTVLTMVVMGRRN